jgi:predicted transcriptional regulator
MTAAQLNRRRITYSASAFTELVLWRLPTHVPGSPHEFKYRPAYVVRGGRVLRYDNDVGKGDHRHFGGKESSYGFTTPEQLIADFQQHIVRGGTMTTVILDVRQPGDSMADFVHAWTTGQRQKSARISFASPELLWQVLTAKRWELLKARCGAGPVSIREAARRVGRDVKAVHGDVTALVNAGLLDRTENARIVFPFDAVTVEFTLQAA